MDYSSIISKPKSFFGKQKVWMARGEDLAIFNTYRSNIQNLLRHSCIPESSHNLWIGLYRVGTTEDEARTFVVVSCSDRRIRKLTRDILSSYPIFQPGEALGRFKVISKATLPETACEPQQTMQDNGDTPFETRLLGEGDYKKPKTTIRIYPSSTGDNYLCRQVQAFQKSEGGDLDLRCQTATAGPLLWLDGVTYQLTVAHVVDFKKKEIDDDPESPDDDVRDWDEEDDDDSVSECSLDEAVASWNISARYNTTPRASNNESTDDDMSDSISSGSGQEDTIQQDEGNIAARVKQTPINKEPTGIPVQLHSPPAMALSEQPVLENFIVEEHSLPRNRLSITSCPISSEMDYLLIPTRCDLQKQAAYGAETVQISDAFDVQERIDTRPIIIATAALGYIDGLVFPAASFLRSPGSKDFQTLFCIQSSETLPRGSSGSAVFDKGSGLLAGHIVLGCPGKNIWYMVPILKVLKDLEVHLCLKANCQIQIEPTATKKWGDSFETIGDTQCRIPRFLPDIFMLNSPDDHQKVVSELSKNNQPVSSTFMGFQTVMPAGLNQWKSQFSHQGSSPTSDRLFLDTFRDLRDTFLEPMICMLPGGPHDERRRTIGKYKRNVPQPQAWMLEIFEPFIKGKEALDGPGLLELLRRKNLLHARPDSQTYTPQCLYIKNIDPSTAMALYKATSWRPMKGCRELFSANASSEPSPVIDILQDVWHGTACFNITVNLPFLFITTQNELFKRSTAGGSDVRTRFDLSFLQIPSQSCDTHDEAITFQTEKSYLLLATWSTIVIGTSERYWTSVCLDDRFGEQLTADDGLEDLKIPLGTLESQAANSKRTMSPRAYALKVLAIQLEKVAIYHQQIISALKFNFNIFEEKVNGPNANGLHHHDAWRSQFRHCASQVSHINSKLVTTVESFLLKELQASPGDTSGHPLWEGFRQEPGAVESSQRIQNSLNMLRNTQSQLLSMNARIDVRPT
ncbi:uncharacterized protein FPRO_05615 [Fusarium proliferatum ET1]|uniref:Uncharacterized protein n=1 Tax=Fusarium proliferatum (strain ET1) TaxID=1227346 RepID=A0A1L7VEU6_FUSPR|nr:uncharacterized protein FPRO_05615 [Fusarium proliferatum ET1]CZR39193.1 uncharacterized protein FPRO_05615 [Fusarium proliferatum ET1]